MHNSPDDEYAEFNRMLNATLRGAGRGSFQSTPNQRRVGNSQHSQFTPPINPPNISSSSAHNTMADPFKPIRVAIKSEYFGKTEDEPLDFVDIFNKASIANKWTEELKLIQFPSYLRGNALSWYNAKSRARTRNGEDPYTCKELTEDFLNSNGPVDTRQDAVEFKLMSMKQGQDETCYQFLIKIENLCNRLDLEMPDSRRIKYVLRGLREEVLKSINPPAPATVAELPNFLTKYDETTILASFNKSSDCMLLY
jgi:hypothetical protein